MRTVLDSVLAGVDGRRTHTFFSYRVAETLLRLGASASAASLPDHLAEACDSTAAIAGLDDGTLPRNYATVLARCEVARSRLGLIPDDDRRLVDLVDRTRRLFASNERGFLDDSRTGIGRYDIYTADVYLFTEPFAERIGPAWTTGAAAAVDLVDRVGASNGAAFAWGRSTGALGIALTVELAGLVTARGLGADPARWFARGAGALASLAGWFSPDDGVIRAHQHRSTFAYRGPHRRLQMTLDCLGKVVDAAIHLRAGAGVDTAPRRAGVPDRNELVEFDGERRAAVWTYRSRRLAFVLPLVGATGSDYLPAPRNPGLFESPVDSGLVTCLPFAIRSGQTYAPALLPALARLRDGELETVHDTFAATGQLEVPDDAPRLGGASRQAVYRVDGRTLRVDERLRFGEVLPHALALQVAESEGRPLRVDVWVDVGADVGANAGADAGVAGADDATLVAPTTIDTAGLKEWRSFWGELPVVHQIEIEPAADVRFSWAVTPKLRVLTSAYEHHYHRALYDPLQADVADARFPAGRMNDAAALRTTLDRCDVFHLHWPEWLFGADLGRHLALIDALHECGVPVVWTQHNLDPHVRDPRLTPIYAAWAKVAAAVLHHSEWGRKRALRRHRFSDDAVHAVVPHPHFGHLALRSDGGRSQVERELRLRAGALRLGVVGAPRPGKDVGLVMRAFARCRRDDLELVVFSVGPDDPVPDDPRVRGVRYEMVPRELYEQRLSAIDVLVLPFADGEMLTTGTVGDVVAHGLPALASSWPFLTEVLGDAAIVYGSTEDDLVAALDRLDREQLERAASASVALRPEFAPEAVAPRLLAVLERLGPRT